MQSTRSNLTKQSSNKQLSNKLLHIQPSHYSQREQYPNTSSHNAEHFTDHHQIRRSISRGRGSGTRRRFRTAAARGFAGSAAAATSCGDRPCLGGHTTRSKRWKGVAIRPRGSRGSCHRSTTRNLADIRFQGSRKVVADCSVGWEEITGGCSCGDSCYHCAEYI